MLKCGLVIMECGSRNPYQYFQMGVFIGPVVKMQFKPRIHRDGLIWGGYIGETLTVNGNKYFRVLQAGKILSSGLADDPSLTKYRIYKIKKGVGRTTTGSKERKISERL